MTAYEVYLAMVKENGDNLYSVPDKFRTPEVCLAAAKESDAAFLYMSEAQRTPEIYLAMVRKKGWNLCFVPEKLRTPKICLEAISQDPGTIVWSPWSILELLALA